MDPAREVIVPPGAIFKISVLALCLVLVTYKLVPSLAIAVGFESVDRGMYIQGREKIKKP
jgi:hypothetical protein